MYNFRQECDPDTNFRDIDFRKNLMKALVDRDRELSWTNKYKHFKVTGDWRHGRDSRDTDKLYKQAVTGQDRTAWAWELQLLCHALQCTPVHSVQIFDISHNYKLSQRKLGGSGI